MLGVPAVSQAAQAQIHPVARAGAHGSAVVRLQRRLNEHGYAPAANGTGGSGTVGALAPNQASNSAMIKMKARPPKYPPGYLHEGDVGPAIRKLQIELTRVGYSTEGIDGYFGPATLRAVILFQKAQHLPDHGLVGYLTWGALSRALAWHTKPAPLSNRGSISPTVAAIVGIAMKYQGYPYYWGGNTPAGFDCSGFVQWVYSQVGIALPRTSFSQWDAGVHVNYDQLAPGDLVFFTTEGVFANHVGIYLGGGEFISATAPGQGVMVQSLNLPFFAQAYDGAVQIIK